MTFQRVPMLAAGRDPHNRTVLSLLAVASKLPSGLNATLHTAPV